MKINFGKLIDGSATNNILLPKDIFKTLPGKDKKYQYLRDVQDQVLTKWFDRRNEEDIIIKMNTGSGKTVIGLLMLQSSLNENFGPAVYVAPDSFLVNQVINEANKLGIEVTDNENSPSFRRGKSILIINIYKLINGKTIFGMRDGPNNISIGSLIIDDVHACLAITEKQFTISIERKDDKYAKIFNIFEEDLKKQSSSKTLEINDKVPYKNMLLPYWAWINKNEEVIKILHDGRDDKDIVFNWPLLKDCIMFCNCVISSEKIEISPKSIPINNIIGFTQAKRRIFMSATLNDDSPLVSHFDVDVTSIKENQITPETADDIGDRLIIVPELINPDICENKLKKLYEFFSKSYNVVIIVPSNYRAEYWKDVTDKIFFSGNIDEGIEELKSRHVGLVVFVNRYDGIDLPESACRVLVIDGLPNINKEFDMIEEGVLHGSERIRNQQIQKIEQGMGRGVRSNTDYCVVFLMGKTLTNILYTENAIEKFSAATKTQINLSEQISQQFKGASLKDINSICKYCLERDKEWISTSRRALVQIKYDKVNEIDDIILGYREAFNYCQRKEFDKAISVFVRLVNKEERKLTKGWLMQQLAELIHFKDPVESQQTLKSALKENIQVLKPIDGISFDKTLKKFNDQSQQFINNMEEKKMDENKFILKINSLLEQINFQPNTSSVFEEAIKEIAFYIGFTAKRPESDVGKGPDVLWRIGNLEFLVIECKNGVENKIISKHDCNQLNGSFNWFKIEYDENNCNQIPIMIHLGNTFEFACSPNQKIRIIDLDRLDKLKKHILEFAKSVVENGNFNNVQSISRLLNEYKLTSTNFIKEYTIDFKVKN